jgi:hypothetical protein
MLFIIIIEKKSNVILFSEGTSKDFESTVLLYSMHQTPTSRILPKILTTTTTTTTTITTTTITTTTTSSTTITTTSSSSTIISIATTSKFKAIKY